MSKGCAIPIPDMNLFPNLLAQKNKHTYCMQFKVEQWITHIYVLIQNKPFQKGLERKHALQSLTYTEQGIV